MISLKYRQTCSTQYMYTCTCQLPASLSLSPSLHVLETLSDPARSTSDSWDTTILEVSCRTSAPVRSKGACTTL